MIKGVSMQLNLWPIHARCAALQRKLEIRNHGFRPEIHIRHFGNYNEFCDWSSGWWDKGGDRASHRRTANRATEQKRTDWRCLQGLAVLARCLPQYAHTLSAGWNLEVLKFKKAKPCSLNLTKTLTLGRSLVSCPTCCWKGREHVVCIKISSGCSPHDPWPSKAFGACCSFKLRDGESC